MIVSYCFSSPSGDVVLDDSTLDRPFAVGPAEYHPFMKLRDFFEAVRKGLLDGASPLASRLSHEWGQPVRVDDIQKLVIRYEKYGTLYQVCSVDIAAAGRTTRICATVARSGKARETLLREFELLQRFQDAGPLDYLPRPLFKREVDVSGEESTERLLVAFLEWFDDYHEWHFSRLADNATVAYIWDTKTGYRVASQKDTCEIIRQASRILCLCYDMATSSRIIPWHHGAGDFVVRTLPEGIDVKLVTVRGYEPFAPDRNFERVDELLGFFLETVTKMRLDKWEGMGESTWADGAVVGAAVEGFVEGVRLKGSKGEISGTEMDLFFRRLTSLGARDITSLLRLQFDRFRTHDASDYNFILRRLEAHAFDLRSALQAVLSGTVNLIV